MESKKQSCTLPARVKMLIGLAQAIVSSMGIKAEEIIATTRESLVEEVELFLRTGDFEAKTDVIVCVNPTLLTMDEKLWRVIICL